MKGGRPRAPLPGSFELLGSPAHRAVARRAVRESLVLLKNDHRLLPLSSRARVLVAGDGADNVAQTMRRVDDRLAGRARARTSPPPSRSSPGSAPRDGRGGSAELSPGGEFTVRPDAAIVVFGENRYAEGAGEAQPRYARGEKRTWRCSGACARSGFP